MWIQLDGDEDLDLLEAAADQAVREIKEAAGDDVELTPHFRRGDEDKAWAHVSLSRPFALRRQEIEGFTEELQKACRVTQNFDIELRCSNWVTLPSEDGQRTFLAFEVDFDKAALRRLIQNLDTVLGIYGKAPYYSSPRFHVTFAHTTSPAARLEALRGNGNRALAGAEAGAGRKDPEDGSTSDVEEPSFEAEAIMFKAGNITAQVPLFRA